MGFFAVFCGLLYNDFMSLPLYLWKSCYQENNGVRKDPDCVYPVGIDPAWYGAAKEINFINSLKMKVSVILGVSHMLLGQMNKGLNAIYFNDKLSFIHEFIPQTLLFLAMFGYMDCLIVIKWLTNYTGKTNQAPSIITTMVGMFLGGGEIKGQPFMPANTFIENILVGKYTSKTSLILTCLFSDKFDLCPLDADSQALAPLVGARQQS